MKTQKLEITGIRLIGFYFLFSTARHIAGAFMAFYYEVQDPDYETLIAAFANAASITQSILAIAVLCLALVSMFRPQWIQRRWRKIDSEEREELDIGSLTLIRMAALLMAFFFGQQSLSRFIEFAMVSNISFSGFNAAQAISNTVFFALSLFLLLKPEVVCKGK